jgi:hypothetical protein
MNDSIEFPVVKPLPQIHPSSNDTTNNDEALNFKNGRKLNDIQ